MWIAGKKGERALPPPSPEVDVDQAIALLRLAAATLVAIPLALVARVHAEQQTGAVVEGEDGEGDWGRGCKCIDLDRCGDDLAHELALDAEQADPKGQQVDRCAHEHGPDRPSHPEAEDPREALHEDFRD